jgi:hypothetical protein
MKTRFIKFLGSVFLILLSLCCNFVLAQIPPGPNSIGSNTNAKQEVSAQNTSSKQEITFIDKWVIPITKVVTLISVIIGIFITYAQYRLKVQAEIRLKDSANAENDVKLLKLFTEIFDVAHGRKDQIISEILIEELFEKNVFSAADLGNLQELNKKIENVANLPIKVGAGAQDAAITAIANLAIKYEILKEPALNGLRIIQTFKAEPTTDLITKINAANKSLKRNKTTV